MSDLGPIHSLEPETKGKKAKKKKKCTKCRKIKEMQDFHNHPGSSDGFAAYCKSCKNDKHKERRSKNISFRLKHHIATRVLKQIPKENQPEGLTRDLEKYLGYRIGKLKRSLSADIKAREGISLKESLIQGYHLDHIKPLSSFQVTHAESQSFQACWALENLRIIPASENLSKGARQDFYDELPTVQEQS